MLAVEIIHVCRATLEDGKVLRAGIFSCSAIGMKIFHSISMSALRQLTSSDHTSSDNSCISFFSETRENDYFNLDISGLQVRKTFLANMRKQKCAEICCGGRRGLLKFQIRKFWKWGNDRFKYGSYHFCVISCISRGFSYLYFLVFLILRRMNSSSYTQLSHEYFYRTATIKIPVSKSFIW